MDLNGDGRLDLVATSTNDDRVNILFGNGNGTFQANVSYVNGDAPSSPVVADVNGDGLVDVISESFNDGRINIMLGNGSSPTSVFSGLNKLNGVSVASLSSARSAQSTLDSYLVEVNSFTGTVGAFVSRLETARSALSIRRENYLAASSQITDADIAEESAHLVKSRILQQAGAAVLTQANQLPALALTLLSRGG